MTPYKSLYYENKNDYDSSLSKLIFDRLNKPKLTLKDLYKVKTIKDLKKYFGSYNDIKGKIETEYLNRSPEDFKTLIDNYENNKYDKAISELQRYLSISLQDVTKMDKLFKTKTTVKDVIDKVIQDNNKLKNTSYGKADFEKDIGY